MVHNSLLFYSACGYVQDLLGIQLIICNISNVLKSFGVYSYYTVYVLVQVGERIVVRDFYFCREVKNDFIFQIYMHYKTSVDIQITKLNLSVHYHY